MTPRVFITPNGIASDKVQKSTIGDSISESKIVSLAHPKTGVPTRYLVQSRQIHSITKVSTPHIKRSLFVGNSIVADGCIYLCTPQDILFHILPHLKKHTLQRSLPLDDILELLPSPLHQIVSPELVQRICECTKSSNSLIPDTYSLSSSRIISILAAKVDALIPVLGLSLVAEYVDKPLALVLGQQPPSNYMEIRSLALRRCSMDIISSTLDEEYSSLLLSTTDFEPLTKYLNELEEARQAAAAAALMIPSGNGGDNVDGEKRVAKEELEGQNAKKKGKVSQGVKALEKVNTRGMKDMRSFFKKPVKT